MSPYISATLRHSVKARADDKCEYCLIHQNFSAYSHEIDHFVATKHGGRTAKENLVLACMLCNRHKGLDLTSIDPINGKVSLSFNSRTQRWKDHSHLKNATILGLTASGRTTIFLLQLNEISRLQVRQSLVIQKLYPDIA